MSTTDLDELAARRTPAAAAAIKEQRAAALARRAESTSRDRGVARHLVVLGRERYGIAAERVLRIAPVPPVTPLPGVPDFVSGAAAFQGQALTLVDLGRLLRVVPGETARPLVVVVRVAHQDVALEVHGVDGVHDAPAVAAYLPAEGAWLAAEHVTGVAAEGLLLLDIERVLLDPRAQVDA